MAKLFNKKIDSPSYKSPGKIERIPSGIPGLDKLIDGGYIKGSTNLITGGAGTGKTLFCSQFIMEGLENGENCMFITLEETPDDIIGDVSVFGWDFPKYVKSGKLDLVYRDPFQVTDIVTPLKDKIVGSGVKRVVVDSTSVLGLYFKDPFEIRKQLFKLLFALKEAGVTSLVTAEIPEDTKQLSRFGVEEFIVDGVIILYYINIATEGFGNIEIRKMRRTKIKKGLYPLEINKNGLNISKNQTLSLK